MKLKKYSANDLAKILPVLDAKELSSIQGGYQAFGAGWAILDGDEIATVFGASDNLYDFPVLPITPHHDDQLSDPFYSVINPQNGWYVDTEAMGYTEGDAAFVSFVNGLLSSWTDDEVSMIDGTPHLGGKYLVPIAAVGSYAQIWGLQDLNFSSSSDQNGNNTEISEDGYSQLANNYVQYMCLLLHCSPVSETMLQAKEEIRFALKKTRFDNVSDLDVHVSLGTYPNGTQYCHLTIVLLPHTTVIDKLYTA
jgi:hypothetical protein